MTLRARVLHAGYLAYAYGPLPQRWKDACVRLAYRLAGPRLFRGERHYELWLRQRREAPRPAAPGAQAGPAGARSRATVLVIDRFVPQPDRDAGSRSMQCVLRALRHMGLRVLFLPRDLLDDPEYVPALEREGIEVLHAGVLQGSVSAWLARHGDAIDYVFLSRPLVAREFLPLLRRHTRARLLFYGHDLHHARLLREDALRPSALLRWEAALVKRIEHAVWRAVDVVYYPSAEETAVVRRVVPAVRAHTLPLYFFDEEPGATGSIEGRTGLLFVAGFGHAPNVEAAQWLVREILPRVRESVPDVHLWLVGSSPTAQVRALAGPQVTVTGYVSDEKLRDFYRSARVAVVPLRVGAGMKGKVLEALHFGVPLVTTPVGAQGLEGVEAVIPVSADARELATAAAALLRDDARWLAVSQAEREFMGSRYSLAAMVEVLAREISAEPAAAPRRPAR